jgi:hypothetical protein
MLNPCLIFLDGLLPAALTRIPTALPAAAAQAARAMAIPDIGELGQRHFQTQVSSGNGNSRHR